MRKSHCQRASCCLQACTHSHRFLAVSSWRFIVPHSSTTLRYGRRGTAVTHFSMPPWTPLVPCAASPLESTAADVPNIDINVAPSRSAFVGRLCRAHWIHFWSCSKRPMSALRAYKCWGGGANGEWGSTDHVVCMLIVGAAADVCHRYNIHTFPVRLDTDHTRCLHMCMLIHVTTLDRQVDIGIRVQADEYVPTDLRRVRQQLPPLLLAGLDWLEIGLRLVLECKLAPSESPCSRAW